jgi:hypothetical protein
VFPPSHLVSTFYSSLTNLTAWQNLSNHTAFQESPAYQPFLKHLASILSGAPSLFHAKFPEDVTPFAAPVTECIRAHFAASQDEDAYLETGWGRFCHEAEKIEGTGAQGSLIDVTPRCIRTDVAAGLVGGWSIERHEYKDEEGKLFAAFIGWPSVEAHMAFRKTEDFGRVVPLLRGEAKGIEVVHVEFVRHA